MLRGYIDSMSAYAQNTRNVHKELKQTVANTSKVMLQIMRVRESGRKIPNKKTRNTYTQTQDIEKQAKALSVPVFEALQETSAATIKQ